LVPLLRSIEVPVQIVWGEEDGWLDSSQAPRLQEEIPKSELRIILGAGHFVQEDAPEEINRELFTFFSREGERK
jgi:pimeloyl-ACP methyl ester carboxylesterase